MVTQSLDPPSRIMKIGVRSYDLSSVLYLGFYVYIYLQDSYSGN
jgi:hypothetical protein